MEDITSDEIQDLLQVYYKLLFPYKQFYNWLSYGGDLEKFKQREFSFTLPGDIYIRYQSFANRVEMEKAIQRKMPVKLDLGAIFNLPPDEGRKGYIPLYPIERELVFDIDMNDYDEVRNCCTGTNICLKCWPFLIVAAKILYRTLTVDFGFKHILFVYSGRRGIHCWVCDKRARLLTDKARAAIVSYINIVEGGAYQAKKVNLQKNKRLHPMVKESLEIIDEHFESLILHKQQLFDSLENVKKYVNLCSDPATKRRMEEGFNQIENCKNAEQRWYTMIQLAEPPKDVKHSYAVMDNYFRFIDELKLQLCYPRLDANVSKSMNHLLKTPFSVHPSTGRVCVPIDIQKIDSFNPFEVPTIKHLNDEINLYDASEVKNKHVTALEKTSLKGHIDFFNGFIENLVRNSAEGIKRKNEGFDF
ncbi:DNA primase small subunit-like protein [Leptotrombidium deliense]|uniref:DNA primase n=1 Tax=Leptotrombidium deliense TaxID=299467 RepID=A0A443S206_9ACAR|nr:DNA primase small subunit-like protein [Leptotrombidium deliense]